MTPFFPDAGHDPACNPSYARNLLTLLENLKETEVELACHAFDLAASGAWAEKLAHRDPDEEPGLLTPDHLRRCPDANVRRIAQTISSFKSMREDLLAGIQLPEELRNHRA